MKKWAILFGGLFLTVVTVFQVSYSNESETSSPVEQIGNGQVVANFNSPLPFEDLISMARKFRMEPKEIYYEENGISGGYAVYDGEDIEYALQDMLNKHIDFLRSVSELNKKAMLAKRFKGRPASDLQKLDVIFSRLLENAQEGRFRLRGVRLENGPIVSTLIKNGAVHSITPIYKKHSESDAKTNEDVPSPKLYSKKHESWAPYGGESSVNQQETYQTFYFNNVKKFGKNSTYEHETQVYDKNFADYDGYWSSNLPSAYYDTPFLDSIDNFTIGSTQASSIRTNTRYYTYMRLRAGSSSTAPVRIKGQKGHRFPSWCHSTWCIFADETTSSMAKFNAPGGMSWIY